MEPIKKAAEVSAASALLPHEEALALAASVTYTDAVRERFGR